MSLERVKWSDLRQSVRDSRRQFGSTAVRVPSNFTFRHFSGPNGQIVTRIYFLASAQAGRENTLHYVDVPNEVSGGEPLTLHWNILIDPSFQPISVSVKVSKEEQLMLERKRLSWSWGITNYDFHSDTGKFVFPCGGSLYGCYDNPTGQVPPVSPTSASQSFRFSAAPTPNELGTSNEGARLNATICPYNPDLVAFVYRGDIWLHHSRTEREYRLTYSNNGEATSPISAGLPAYIIQEEFSRFIGFWWRPCDKDGQYVILYEEVDESEVDLIKFPTSLCGDVEEFRFPKAGSTNAQSSLKTVKFEIDCQCEIVNIESLELRVPLESIFPWMEYIVRCGWTPDGTYTWCQILDRRQQMLQLVLIPTDEFVPPSQTFLNASKVQENGSLYNGIHSAPTVLPRYHVICTSKSSSWINVTDILDFYPSEDSHNIRFIWASEETGWCHLYLITAQIHSSLEDYSDTHLRANILSQIPLTNGEWCVIDKQIRVDWSAGFVYFQGLKETPLEKHLYVVSIQQPGFVKRITEAGYSHSINMDEKCSVFVTVFSNIQSLPACQVFRLHHQNSAAQGVSAVPVGWLLPPTALDRNYQYPELFSHVISSGDTLHGMIFKPHEMSPGVKYPVVLSIYGGPEVQLVSNTFKGMRQMRSHLLASQGYCVICIDSRGSHSRGVAFESHLKLRMGQLELSDQVEVLKWLSETTDFLDMTRVAIHGWSYGGYLSLMALVQYPDLFKLAIAGAPVTDWSLYDTAYTERYMDLPSNNPSGYSLGSVLTYGNDFPDEPNRLLIVHGLMDENVHFFQHTAQLISSFIRCGKPYQLQVYPGERHSLRHLDASEHFETTLLAFLKEHL